MASDLSILRDLPLQGTLPTNEKLLNWLAEVVALCRPAAIHYCDGSPEEQAMLAQRLLDAPAAFDMMNDAIHGFAHDDIFRRVFHDIERLQYRHAAAQQRAEIARKARHIQFRE